MNFDKGDILKNFERFLKFQCEKHYKRITYFCTSLECINNKKSLLCIECFNVHTKDHSIIPSYDIFSYNLLDDIKRSMKLEEEELSKSYESKLLTLEQIDEIYNQIQVDLIEYLSKILQLSKMNVIQRLSRDEYKGYPQKLHQEFEECLTDVFNRAYENIKPDDIEYYSKTYSKIFNDLKAFKINYVALINEQILEANRKINDLLMESSKLRMAFEDFDKKILSDNPLPKNKGLRETESNNSSLIMMDNTSSNEETKESEAFLADSNVKALKHTYNLDQLKEAIKNGETSLYVLAWGSGDDLTAKDISTALLEPNQITSLDIGFGYKSITNKGVKSICSSLEKCKNLKTLKLWFGGGKNKISNEGAKSIANAISQLPNLTQLGLLLGGGSNQIGDEGLKDLSKSIEQLANLAYLDISFGGGRNKITDEGLKSLAQALNNLPELKFLKLWFWNDTKESTSINSLLGKGLKASLLNNSSGQNAISSEGVKALAITLGKLLNLSELLLSFEGGMNKITDDCIKPLGEALANLPVLDNIWINMEKGSNKVSEASKIVLENACAKCKGKKIFI